MKNAGKRQIGLLPPKQVAIKLACFVSNIFMLWQTILSTVTNLHRLGKHYGYEFEQE